MAIKPHEVEERRAVEGYHQVDVAVGRFLFPRARAEHIDVIALVLAHKFVDFAALFAHCVQHAHNACIIPYIIHRSQVGPVGTGQAGGIALTREASMEDDSMMSRQ